MRMTLRLLCSGAVAGACALSVNVWAQPAASPATPTPPLRQFMPASVRAAPNLSCRLHAPDRPPASGVAVLTDADGYARFHAVKAAAGSASIPGGIKAVSRNPGTMEVFWTAPNGSMQDAFWYENSTWKHFELAPPGRAAAAGGLTALSRIPASMELWWIAPDGSVVDDYFYDF